MKKTTKPARDKIQRVSISIPESVLLQLDAMVRDRGFESRSQAITEMINHELVDYNEKTDDQIMAGTITLFYDHSKNNLKKQLADIQYRHVAEVISSFHIFLEREHTMEVLLVQGPARTLKTITDELVTCKGVKTGKLNLTTTLMPPLHFHYSAQAGPK